MILFSIEHVLYDNMIYVLVLVHVYAYGPKTVLVKCTLLEMPGRRLCWGGGVGWGGHVNVLCSAYIRCCYVAEISGFVATLHAATLQRSLVSLLRYMLLRCRDLWFPCYVTCCYAAEISGILTTLPLLLRCRDLWYPCYVTCCYAAEISGILATLHVATLQRSLVSLRCHMLLRCRDLWFPCYVTCCYAAEISSFLATLHVATLQRSLVSLRRHHQMPYRQDWCCLHQLQTIHPQLFGCQAQRCHVVCQDVAMAIQ